MKKILVVVAAVLSSGTALAQKPMPAPDKAMEAACEAKIRAQLVAPMEAKVVPGTAKYSTKPAYSMCLQARTAGGGFGLVHGTCWLTPDGKTISKVDMTSNPTFLCDL